LVSLSTVIELQLQRQMRSISADIIVYPEPREGEQGMAHYTLMAGTEFDASINRDMPREPRAAVSTQMR